MNINELRLDNWVFFDSDSFPEQVRMESFAILYKYPERINSIKPIPLTPEILEKCGFEKWGQCHELIVNEKSIQIEGDKVFLAGQDSVTDMMCFTCDLKYLHQLQNLYFALTGNELKKITL